MDMGEENNKAFFKMNAECKQVAEYSHFVRNQDTPIFCDASKKGMVVNLRQIQTNDEWTPTSFSSRF